jgi:glycosyltransferase involved in cell wall biosynthesis
LPVIFFWDIHYLNTIHTLPERHDANAGIVKKILTHYLFRSNKVRPITISETCHKSYCKTYKIQNDICIPNGSEPLRTTEELGLVKKEIDTLKKNSDTTVFIHVGRNHPVKNHGRLFNTFLRLEEERANFILIVLGNDYDSWEAKLKDSKSVFLLGSKKNVGDYMAQAEFFVLSSDFEGLPMTLLEAMSMGVIPISTPAGGVVDVIKDGVTGYLSESFEDDIFYRKVKQAIVEKGNIPSEKIKEYYERNYSMEICANNYYQTYLEASNNSK